MEIRNNMRVREKKAAIGISAKISHLYFLCFLLLFFSLFLHVDEIIQSYIEFSEESPVYALVQISSNSAPRHRFISSTVQCTLRYIINFIHYMRATSRHLMKADPRSFRYETSSSHTSHTTLNYDFK